MLRMIAIAFAILFAIVVAIGYWPPFVTAVNGEERTLFDLFAISLLDDITHGLTAIAALAAAVLGRDAARLFFIGFGSYYALDAAFYLTYGLFNDLTWIQDLLLNLPHVLIAAVMLGVVGWESRGRVRAPARAVA